MRIPYCRRALHFFFLFNSSPCSRRSLPTLSQRRLSVLRPTRFLFFCCPSPCSRASWCSKKRTEKESRDTGALDSRVRIKFGSGGCSEKERSACCTFGRGFAENIWSRSNVDSAQHPCSFPLWALLISFLSSYRR